MRDTPLFTAVRTVLLAGFAQALDAPANVKVKQLYQPTQMGADTGPTVYFQKLFDVNLGAPQRKLVWDPAEFDYENHLVQKIATTFQVSGVFKQTAATAGWTAADVANEARARLQDDAAIAAFLFIGVGVERVTQVRNPPFVDGQAQYEFFPNFDFVLTHDQVTVSRTPGATAFELDIERV